MKTVKSILSGWPNKWFLLLLISGFCRAQEAASSKGMLQSQFSRAALEAYQDNGDGKVRDFYHYLNLLSETNDPNLKAQLQQSIYGLFEDRNVVIENFLTPTADRIPLPYLLENVFGRKMTFALVAIHSGNQFGRDSWNDGYTLQITSAETVETRRLNQTVYLKPKPKQFGETVKNVWTISLGTIYGSD